MKKKLLELSTFKKDAMFTHIFYCTILLSYLTVSYTQIKQDIKKTLLFLISLHIRQAKAFMLTFNLFPSVCCMHLTVLNSLLSGIVSRSHYPMYKTNHTTVIIPTTPIFWAPNITCFIANIFVHFLWHSWHKGCHHPLYSLITGFVRQEKTFHHLTTHHQVYLERLTYITWCRRTQRLPIIIPLERPLWQSCLMIQWHLTTNI